MSSTTATPPPLRRPRLKSTLDQVVGPDGTLYIVRPGAAEAIAIERPSEAQRRLLHRLRTPTEPAVLRAELGAELPVDDVLAQLVELGLVEDVADDELLAEADRERYDRQLA